MKTLRFALFAAVLFVHPAITHAQDFGVTESAETIDKGNFKLKANPMFVFGDGNTTTGIAAGVGYGFTPRLDAEVHFAGYDGVTFIGGDVEYWLVKGGSVDVSGSAGFHFANTSGTDQTGVDLTGIASGHATPRLDIYGAIDLAFNKYRDDFPNNNYTQAHFVPGIEYKLHQDLDLLAELGLSLNDNGNHYFSVGIAYYLR